MLLTAESPHVSVRVELFEILVRVGEEKSLVTLPHPLHLFLVECLAEHVADPEIVHRVLALDFLNSGRKVGEQGNLFLKRAGDAALLLAGLFPERALRLRVSSSYFRCMGQAAYGSLATRLLINGKRERSSFYNSVAKQFELLEAVLKSARREPESEWEAFQRFRTQLQ